MIIHKLEWKNVKSYGNILQTLEFGNSGNLILMAGKNGNGKSAIKTTLELCLFRKVQGEKGKRLSIEKLPNRRNGALYAGIEFKNKKNQLVKIKTYIQPKNFEMWVDDVDYSKKFSKLSEKEKEEIVGYTFEVFKSFISLNINDFKNFISLTNEDKENLLNKLFNLTELDNLLSLSKELDKNNQKSIDFYENLIYDNEVLISEYSTTINTIKSKIVKNREDRLNETKEKILIKKPRYSELEELLKKCDSDNEDVRNKFNKLKKLKSSKEVERNKLELRLEDLNKKIICFESGVCPICETNLKDDIHSEKLSDYIENRKVIISDIDKAKKYLEQCILEDTKLNNKNREIYNNRLKYSDEFNTLKLELSSLTIEYKKLKDSEVNENYGEFVLKVGELKEKNNEYLKVVEQLNKKKDTYKTLIELFSVDGVRKNIIKNIIKPVNKHLSNFLTKLESEYKAVLDENFDAKIYELETLEIDADTISKGEDKKINIAIALSYLKMILDMRYSNVIFLDEIFDGVDSENIELILKVLKIMAKEHNINIIVVYHGNEVKMNNFDYIIKVKKDIFSSIEVNKNH